MRLLPPPFSPWPSRASRFGQTYAINSFGSGGAPSMVGP